MEIFRIGDYEIEPQVSETTARLVVRRKPNPHGTIPLYVSAYFGPEGTEYRVNHPAGDQLENDVGHRTWSRGLRDAMNRIEAIHTRYEAELVRRNEEQVRQKQALRQSRDELLEFIDRQAGAA